MTSRTGALARVAGIVVLLPVVAACTDSGPENNGPTVPQTTTAAAEGKHGPMFPQCGGISDQTVAELTQVGNLVATTQNSVGCQWLVSGGIIGPHFSFSWYRGSPIGRERKTEELTRTNVEDIDVDGHPGFIAMDSTPSLGNYLCEVGIQFDDDFIEWSISYSQKPFPDACDVAKELTQQSIANAK